MGLRLTNAADYAVRAMIHIACLPEGAVALSGDIARAYGIPSSFMAKILRQLVRAGLLQSFRGARGGFGLARPAGDIHLLDVVEAIEGPLALTGCMDGESDGCEWSAECPAHPVWARVQDKMTEILRGSTLEMLVSSRRRNGRVLFMAQQPEPVARTKAKE